MLSTTRALGLGRRSILSARTTARRTVQTQSLPPSKATEILNQQRLLRPSSPHFTIYQPQLTWIPSIVNRATGGALSALLYGFSLAYLVAPGTFDSVHVVEFVAGLPDAVKYAGKALLAAPFAFHGLNGIRHLLWDMGKFMSIKGVYQTGYTVIAGTAVGTVVLVLL
ncbi:SDHC, cytochrome b subunit of succinate dehydrogenase [Roridomyces roridus]|uniref:SDHC, cytochrome b subunit of succinate dehydrogenase n=1 Tax=Roridomyces roridus TaxID=1738132 RepID=A0AAD7C7D8_9AGAR|nr:SDHC, cytochrome b subunit of succinate dehydrogenase [Roridomyces roridus]